MSAVSEDGLIILVNRIEALAGKACRVAELEAKSGMAAEARHQLQKANAQLRNDLKAAEKKIAEWAEYASVLRSAITQIDGGALKRKRIVLPDMPAPFETDIPF